MDGVLIFVRSHTFILLRANCINGRTCQAGLFSAALTAFIIDRYQNIQPNPAQQSAYFQQQSTILLNQISHQLASLGAPIPSNLSLPGPTLSSSRSDIRVNTCWFISLVSSLSAALLATLVQRWARYHMHVFQRYGHPLKIARIRQYLHEGVERWRMLAIAEAVPGLVHISLFLFFIGLADFLLNTSTIVGILTICPIIICGTIYIIGTVVPLTSPQSPYRTSFTGLAWFIIQRIFKRRCKDRSGKAEELLSSKMADGQMQLAMAKDSERKGRDERAIRWLVNNLTEDIEMDSLVSGIPGSFDAKWGVEVWKNESEIKKDEGATSSSTGPTPPLPSEDNPATCHPQLSRPRTLSRLLGYIGAIFRQSQPGNSRPAITPPTGQTDSNTTPQPPSHPPVRGDIVHDLCQRIQRLFETCNHRGSFVNEDEWRRRSRGCVETAASFVFCLGADIGSFGDIGKQLRDLGSAESTREVSASSLNRTFTTRWTCLSLVAIRNMLKSSELGQCARGTMQTLGTLSQENGPADLDTALGSSRRIDRQFADAWDCVDRLRQTFLTLGEGNKSVERVEQVLLQFKPTLERIQAEADRMELVDKGIFDLQKQIDQVTHDLIRQLPGVAFDDRTGPTPVCHIFDFLANPVQPQLLYLSQRLFRLCSICQRRSSQGYLNTSEVLRGVHTSLRSVPRKLMERQLWRLEDLNGGGAFGFTLELYFLTLKQILSTFTSSPREIDTSFYIGAFKTITSDREQVKGSLGTLQIILNMVCDIAIRNRGIFSNFRYPDYINKELLELLGNMVKGQEGQAKEYIEAAAKELLNVGWRKGDEDFLKNVLETIRKHVALSASSS